MRRVILLLAALAAFIGLSAPVAASASTTSAAHPVAVSQHQSSAHQQAKKDCCYYVYNDATGTDLVQGDGIVKDGGTMYQLQNLYYEGQVSNTSSNCWPFTCGNGANNYFLNKSVYVIYQDGTNYCWQVQGSSDLGNLISNQQCGRSHPYSLFVQTGPHDGDCCGGYESWASVGETDGANGSGRYVYDYGVGNEAIVNSWSSNSADFETHQSFHHSKSSPGIAQTHTTALVRQQAKHDPVNSLLWNTYYKAYQGGDGHGNFIDQGTFDRLDMIGDGTVSSTDCAPFSCGGGLNNTYNGDGVYVAYYHGSNTCVSMSGSWTVSASGVNCSGNHYYSLWVKTQNPVDGQTGHSSWVNVGSSNYYGHGEYLSANGLGVTDEVDPYGYNTESFIWTN
jgi:hypothetical protein